MRARTYLTLIAVPLTVATLGGSGFAATGGQTASPAATSRWPALPATQSQYASLRRSAPI